MNTKQKTVSGRTFPSGVAIAGVSGALGTLSDRTFLTSCTGSGKEDNALIPLRPSSEVYIPELGDKTIEGKPIFDKKPDMKNESLLTIK